MSASALCETQLLALIFTNADFAALGLRGSPVAGNLYLSLHTADPDNYDDQRAGETNYGGYARVAVPRSAAGWAVAGSVATLLGNADFPACTDSAARITHFGLGTAASGAGVLLFSGPVTPPISVSRGVVPRLTLGTQVTAD